MVKVVDMGEKRVSRSSQDKIAIQPKKRPSSREVPKTDAKVTGISIVLYTIFFGRGTRNRV